MRRLQCNVKVDLRALATLVLFFEQISDPAHTHSEVASRGIEYLARAIVSEHPELAVETLDEALRIYQSRNITPPRNLRAARARDATLVEEVSSGAIKPIEPGEGLTQGQAMKIIEEAENKRVNDLLGDYGVSKNEDSDPGE